MKRHEMLLAAGALLGAISAFALHPARAQTPTQTKGSVEVRIATLEQKISALEAQNAELRNVIQISTAAGSVTIKPSGKLKLVSASLELELTGSAEIKTSSNLTLKGALININ